MNKSQKPIVTLTTDFGVQDPYVGIMKGVILGIVPEAQIVDITHGIQSHDVMEAALILKAAFRFFPLRTIHVVVVDPGVGSQRRPLLVTAEQALFVAPDNGVLDPVLSETGFLRAYHLTEPKYFLNQVGSTFHGRDVFAPVAGWLCSGVSPSEFGPPVSSLASLELPRLKEVQRHTWIGTILRIDKFGNLITNIPANDFLLRFRQPASFRIILGHHQISRLRHSYSESPPGELFAIWGSAGFLEISCNQSSAAEMLHATKRMEFKLMTFSVPGAEVSG